MYVRIGSARVFNPLPHTRDCARKPLVEAGEVQEAWGRWEESEARRDEEPYSDEYREALLDEIADCIQACANLAACVGVTDLAPYMARCEDRNRERGRYAADTRVQLP